LRHLDLDFGNVAKANIFLTDLTNFQKVNAIYEKWLNGPKPARATIQVAALPAGALVEIEMVAVLR
ncbi:MAG: reactive intermediate/imine deaminase, partial [Proteobacteria bacterium]